MAFDYKKECKELYVPPKTPRVVEVPPMRYIAVRGAGDPNAENSEYKQSIAMLYAVAFTIKMSKMGSRAIEGYFDFVVPPLEGFWSQEGNDGPIDYTRKGDFDFVSCIRMPDFVTDEVFKWAVGEAEAKKGMDLSKVELIDWDEDLCVQCLHVGPYDDEPATIDVMMAYAASEGFALDLTDTRLHHEIYLSDPRKCAPERLRTVIRIPIKPVVV